MHLNPTKEQENIFNTSQQCMAKDSWSEGDEPPPFVSSLLKMCSLLCNNIHEVQSTISLFLLLPKHLVYVADMTLWGLNC